MNESSGTVKTPSGETLSVLQKHIAGYVLAPTDPEVLEAALAGIRRGIDRLNMHAWNWALTYDDINFGADTTDYQLASWFKAPHNFEIWDENQKSCGRFTYKPWKTFLIEHSESSGLSDPPVYSCANAAELGTITLEGPPGPEWVSKHPSGRLWYHRYLPYPVSGSQQIDAPSFAQAYLYEWACGHVANSFAIAKAAAAILRARELFDPQSHTGAMLLDDNAVYTDWE